MASSEKKSIMWGVAGLLTGITLVLPTVILLEDEINYIKSINTESQNEPNYEFAKREYQLRMNNLKIDILTQEVKCLKTYPERIDYEKGIVFPCVVPSSHDDNMQELELMHRFPKQFLDEILDEMNSK